MQGHFRNGSVRIQQMRMEGPNSRMWVDGRMSYTGRLDLNVTADTGQLSARQRGLRPGPPDRTAAAASDLPADHRPASTAPSCNLESPRRSRRRPCCSFCPWSACNNVPPTGRHPLSSGKEKGVGSRFTCGKTTPDPFFTGRRAGRVAIDSVGRFRDKGRPGARTQSGSSPGWSMLRRLLICHGQTIFWGLLVASLSGCTSMSGLLLRPGPHKVLPSAERLAKQRCLSLDSPRELEKQVLSEYRVEPGDVLVVEPVDFNSTMRLPNDQTVLPDGTIELGRYGRLQVAGGRQRRLRRRCSGGSIRSTRGTTRNRKAQTASASVSIRPKARCITC